MEELKKATGDGAEEDADEEERPRRTTTGQLATVVARLVSQEKTKWQEEYQEEQRKKEKESKKQAIKEMQEQLENKRLQEQYNRLQRELLGKSAGKGGQPAAAAVPQLPHWQMRQLKRCVSAHACPPNTSSPHPLPWKRNWDGDEAVASSAQPCLARSSSWPGMFKASFWSQNDSEIVEMQQIEHQTNSPQQIDIKGMEMPEEKIKMQMAQIKGMEMEIRGIEKEDLTRVDENIKKITSGDSGNEIGIYMGHSVIEPVGQPNCQAASSGVPTAESLGQLAGPQVPAVDTQIPVAICINTLDAIPMDISPPPLKAREDGTHSVEESTPPPPYAESTPTPERHPYPPQLWTPVRLLQPPEEAPAGQSLLLGAPPNGQLMLERPPEMGQGAFEGPLLLRAPPQINQLIQVHSEGPSERLLQALLARLQGEEPRGIITPESKIGLFQVSQQMGE